VIRDDLDTLRREWPTEIPGGISDAANMAKQKNKPDEQRSPIEDKSG